MSNGSHHDLRITSWKAFLLLTILLSESGVALSQVQTESMTLTINGKTGAVPVVQVSQRSYVDLEVLARIANGSLSFQGNQISLTLPCAGASDATSSPEPTTPVGHVALSQNFMIAGIETISEMREWASAMEYAIENSYTVTESWAANNRASAERSLTLARAAAVTESDRNALQLLTNEFEMVKNWSDKLVQASSNLDTAKYSTSPKTLRNEALSQKIIQCGRFLGTMLGSAEFKDDPSCH